MISVTHQTVEQVIVVVIGAQATCRKVIGWVTNEKLELKTFSVMILGKTFSFLQIFLETAW